MIHPDTELKIVSEEIGLGVFATKNIPAGTIVYVKDPLEIIISEEQFQTLPEPVKIKADIYSYIESTGMRVLSWDSAKFVNHCCNANTLSTGYGFEIAIRDIAVGEEITDDYGMFNITHDMKLYCGCENCRGELRASDFPKLVPYWDEQVKNALSKLNSVKQPLLELIPSATSGDLYRYLESGRDYISVAALELDRSAQKGKKQAKTKETAKLHSIKTPQLKMAASSGSR